MKPDNNWEQVKDIFERAMAMAPESRGEFLDEACAGNNAVKAEVEDLLNSWDDAEDFLETPAIARKDELQSGQFIDSYEVIEKLGEGGIGKVYLAKDDKLKRNVAIKLLSADFMASSEYVKRFEREALAVSSLNHPNILTIYEIGKNDGADFIVTEFINGETLRRYLKRKIITFREILDIAVQAVSALAAAHEAGIVHRDIKPENIMIRQDGIVKVLDFGLAKAFKSGTGSSETGKRSAIYTEEGMILGTITYMSPEQARGKGVDAQSDLWSFGAVLYEMSAGRPPFEGETNSDIIAAILKTAPAPLPVETPDELQKIVTKTLSQEKSERYQSAKDLLADLTNLKRELEVSESPGRRAGRLSGTGVFEKTNDQVKETLITSSIGYVEDHKFVSVLVLIVLLFIVSLAGFYFWQNKPPVSQTQALPPVRINTLAVLPFESAAQDTEYFSDGVTESLINNLSNVPNLRVISRDGVFNFKNSGQTPQQIGITLAAQTVLTGKVLQQGDSLTVQTDLIRIDGNVTLWSERFDVKTSDILKVQSEIARQITDKLQLQLDAQQKEQIAKHYTENTEAYREYLKGRFYTLQYTLEGHKKALEHLNAAVEIDPTYALAYAGIADAYTTASDTLLPPREALAKAKAAANKALELDNTLAEAWAAHGHARLHEWDRSAIDELNKAAALAPNSLTTQLWLGEYYMIFDVEKSVPILEKAGELDPLSPIPPAFLGFDYYLLRRNERAIEYAKKAIAINPHFYTEYAYFARLYAGNGDFTAAINELNNIPPEMTDGMTVSTKAVIFAGQGKKRETEKIIADLQKLSTTQYVSPFEFAIIYASLGDRERMFSYLEKAYDDRSENLGFIRSVPYFDAYRDDPRYQELIHKIGF